MINSEWVSALRSSSFENDVPNMEKALERYKNRYTATYSEK